MQEELNRLEKICETLKERFDQIDQMSEFNQLKVMQAFHNNRVSAEHMNGTDITAVAANVAASMSNRFFTSPAFIGSSTARTQVGNVVLYTLKGSKSAEKALQDALANCGGNK